ncbi:hypothetical protein MTO96_044467 [Rhipicephalus appendiculatus]
MGQPPSRLEADSFGVRRTVHAAPADRLVLPDLSYDGRAGLPISNLRQAVVGLYQAPVDPSKFGNCETVIEDTIKHQSTRRSSATARPSSKTRYKSPGS